MSEEHFVQYQNHLSGCWIVMNKETGKMLYVTDGGPWPKIEIIADDHIAREKRAIAKRKAEQAEMIEDLINEAMDLTESEFKEFYSELPIRYYKENPKPRGLGESVSFWEWLNKIS